MRKLSVLLLCLAAVAGFSVPAYSMTVIPAGSAEALAHSLAGAGITISDVRFAGDLAAAGYFSEGPAETGLEKGTVLTTGFASNLNGTSNTSDEITGVNNTAGDPGLDAMIPGYSTFDAAVLSFDFIPSGDTLEFSYIFGSEEYDEYADSDYNDVFGIFIDGVNYALVPETDTPVSASSINSASYSEYYNDNDAFKSFGGFRKPYPYPFEYDGFTDLLTTSVTGLTPGETYTLRLAVADAGDMFLDSGIFFPGDTFKCPAAPAVPEPGTVFLLGSGLICLAAAGRKKKFLSV